MNTEDEVIHEHLATTGKVAHSTMQKLKEHDYRAWHATMQVLQAGGMLTVRSTASLAGVRMLTIDLIGPAGDMVTLMSVELHADPTTLN